MSHTKNFIYSSKKLRAHSEFKTKTRNTKHKEIENKKS